MDSALAPQLGDTVADPIKPIFFANEEFFRFLLATLSVCYI